VRKVRMGIIGLGGMGISHIDRIKNVPEMELTAVCDSRQEVADEQAAKHDANAYTDADAMMLSGEIDAVLIATPHNSHPKLTIAAFEAGVHVLSEKPIAVHKADAEAMIAAHKQHPELKFSAMFQMRADSVYKKIKQLIDDGELGKIQRVNWIITNWFRSQSYYDSSNWRATWKGEGGGVLLNQSPHQLDLFQWFFGMPSKVRAFCSLGKYHNIEVEDDVTAYCEFSGGYTGVFITSTGEAPGTNRLEVSGDRGRLVFENGKLTFNRSEGSIENFAKTTETWMDSPPMWNVDIPVKHSTDLPHKIIGNFADAILNNADLIAEGEEGIKSVELANSMLLSTLDSTVIDIPFDSAKYTGKLQELIKNSTFVKPEVKTPKVVFTPKLNN